MTTLVYWIAAAALAVSGLPALAYASPEVDRLLDKLVEKGVLTQQDAGEIRQEMASEKAASMPAAAKDSPPSLAQGLAFNGDMRLRYEAFDRDSSTTSAATRNRGRFRLRVGAKSKVTDQLEAGLRLATGTNLDPGSTNQSFGDSFDKKDVFIDQAYVKYTTAGTEWMEPAPATLWGGKFENPFYMTGLTWDPDLTPEGVAASLTPTIGPVDAFTTAGFFPMDEVALNGSDPFVVGAQAGGTWKAADNLSVKGAVGYFDYANLENGIDVFTNSTFGNSGTAAANVFRPASGIDYDDVSLLGEINTRLLGQPLKLHGDYVKNVAISDNDEGWALGFKVGKADKPKAWEAGYYYERLEPDAVLGLFADSDFGEGGSNRMGHVYYAAIGTLKNSTLGFKWFVTEAVTGPDSSIDRLQIDWNTKF